MRFNLVIRLEEVVEELVTGKLQPQLMFKKIDDSQVDFVTDVIPTPQLSYSFA